MSAPAAAPEEVAGTAVTLKAVEKVYPQGSEKLYVLRRIDLQVREGEFVSLMGPSGAGKTTLLQVLGLQDHAFGGEFYFFGHAVHRLDRGPRLALQRENVGFVFQSYHLLDDLTVAENLDLPLSYRNVPRSERQARVADALDRFGIVAKKDLYPRQLSGGQQQLVAIARAIVARPRLILADEPTGNLHSEQAREIMRLFQRLNGEGVTIVQATHSDENASYGHRIVRLRDGWIVP